MSKLPRITATTLTCFVAVCSAASGTAQHFDVLVQSVDQELVTGTTDFDVPVGMPPVTTLGVRVYFRPFNSLFAVDDPGFNSVGTTTGTVPPGSDALPGNSELLWDFLPMKVGGVTSNLLYWTGAGATPAAVSFGPAPTVNYSLSLFGQNDVRVAADGTDQLVPGSIIDTTAADGFIHIHRFFFLDNDHDDNNATVAADGVYLIAMRLRMAGLDRSDPIYIVWGTSGATSAALSAAKTRVEDCADQLAPNFAADLDGDLDVDGADFLTWQRGLGTAIGARQIHGDANRDHAVTASDSDLWRSEFGSSLATFPGASAAALVAAAPEPDGAVVATAALIALVKRRRGRMTTIARP